MQARPSSCTGVELMSAAVLPQHRDVGDERELSAQLAGEQRLDLGQSLLGVDVAQAEGQELLAGVAHHRADGLVGEHEASRLHVGHQDAVADVLGDGAPDRPEPRQVRGALVAGRLELDAPQGEGHVGGDLVQELDLLRVGDHSHGERDQQGPEDLPFALQSHGGRVPVARGVGPHLAPLALLAQRVMPGVKVDFSGAQRALDALWRLPAGEEPPQRAQLVLVTSEGRAEDPLVLAANDAARMEASRLDQELAGPLDERLRRPLSGDELVDVADAAQHRVEVLDVGLVAAARNQQVPLAERPVDDVRQRRERLRRLHQVVERSRLHGLDGDLLVTEAGHDQHRKLAGHRRRRQRLQRPAVGQVQVEQREVRRVVKDGVSVLAERPGDHQLGGDWSRLKGATNGLGVRRLVLRDQQAQFPHGHHAAPAYGST